MAAFAPYRGYQIVKQYGEDIAEEIIDLWKEGYSIPRILEFFENEDIELGKGTVESFIKTAKDPKSLNPFKIKKADITNRPNIVGANQFKAQSYINDNQIVNRIEKAAKAGKQSVTEFLENNPDLNRTSLYQYLNKTGTTFKKVDQGKPEFQQYVTDRVKDLQKIIKKDPNASGAELLQQFGLPTETYNSTVQALKKSYETPRPKFKPDPKLKTKVLSLSDKIPTSFETKIFDDMKKLGIDPNLLDTDHLKKVTRSRRSLSEFFDETNFEHRLPKQVLTHIDDPNKKLDLLLTGTRTTPELNQFKKRYDNLMGGLVNQLKNNKISLKQYNQQRDQIVNEVKRITGGYEMGYLKFNKAGPDAKATAVVKQKPFYEGTKLAGPEKSQIMSAFENAKFHNNLIKKYKANPNLPAFSRLREFKPAENTRLLLDEEKAFNKFKNIVGEQNKQKFLQKAAANINSPFIQAIFKAPYGKGAAVTGAIITPTALSAQEAPTQFEALEKGDIDYGDPETWNMKVGQFIEEAPILSGTAAASAPLLTKPGRAAYKKIGTQAFKAIGTPFGAGLLTYALRPEEGYDLSDPLTRIGFETEAALAKPLVRESQRFARQIPASSPMLRRATQGILNLGMPARLATGVARFATPLGLASLGLEGGYQFYQALEDEKARIAAMSPEEREMFEQEQTAAAYIMGEAGGYAYGGRVGLEEGGDPKDPSRRKFIKRGAGILGALTALGTGAIKLAPKIAQEVKKVAPDFSSIHVPAIVEELYSTIKKFGKQTEYPKPGSDTIKYEMGPYKMEEGPGGYDITKTNDRGEYGYSEEYFEVYKDPETGSIEYEELTIQPDMDGKLKDVDYGVDAQTYRDIGEDLSKTTGNDEYKFIAEEDIQGVLDDGGYIMDQGVLKSGKR